MDTKNLRIELELEKKRSAALEEQMELEKKRSTALEKQMLGIKEEHHYLKDTMEIMMEQLSQLSRVQSQNSVS